MVISSLIVETFPYHTDEVVQRLNQTSHVEVHGSQQCQIVVTIETDTVDQSHAIASSFAGFEGVGSVNLVYVNFEDDPFLVKAAAR